MDSADRDADDRGFELRRLACAGIRRGGYTRWLRNREKKSGGLADILKMSQSSDHAHKIWGLWVSVCLEIVVSRLHRSSKFYRNI